MRDFRRVRIGVILVAAALFLSSAALPFAHAGVSGPYSLWYDYSVWNNRYVGNTVEFDFYVYNTDPSTPTDTISSVQLVTPWQTYSAAGLPTSVCEGCSYDYIVNVTIPATQQPGSVSWTVRFTGTYSTGSAFCSSTGNVCSSTFSLSISPDPYALQTQVTSLQQTVTSLNANITSLKSQVSSLQGQVTAAKNNITSLQSQIQTYKSQVSSLQSELTAAQNSVTTLQGQVTAAKNNITSLKQDVQSKTSQIQSLQASLTATANDLQKAKSDLTATSSALDAAKATLATTQASLAATQSSLATVSSVYLPVGVAVPAIIAALFLVLYLRKGPRPAPVAAGIPSQQPPSAMAPPTETAASKFCSNCGTANKLSAKFCAKCGTGLS